MPTGMSSRVAEPQAVAVDPETRLRFAGRVHRDQPFIPGKHAPVTFGNRVNRLADANFKVEMEAMDAFLVAKKSRLPRS